jgi:poly(A) polymerase
MTDRQANKTTKDGFHFISKRRILNQLISFDSGTCIAADMLWYRFRIQGNIMAQILINSPLLKEIGALADEYGIQLFVVGGYVRDTLLGMQTKDIDLSVVGDGVVFAELVAKRFPVTGFTVFERFGTVNLKIGELEIEFVGTRKELYEPDSRKPIVTIGTIEDDLRRRDFTVNAMAVSINAVNFGELLDLFDGKNDLDAKILRTPLDPVQTFSDDPLRMMRAFRFAAQLGFEIEPSASDAISAMSERIAVVSIERIRDEFLKILTSPKPSEGLHLMHRSGLMKRVLPDIHELTGVDQRSVDYPEGPKAYHHKDVFFHTLQVVDNVAAVSNDVWLRLAALLHDIAKPRTKAFKEGIGWTFHGHAELGVRMTDKFFRALKLPLTHLAFVKKLVALHLRPMSLVDEGVTDSAIRRLLFEAGEDIDELLILCRADITSHNPSLINKYLRNYELLVQKMREVEEKDRLRNWQPPLTGDDIMKVCAIPPGLAVGILKTKIEDAILDGIIPNNHDAALRYLLSIKDDVLKQPELRKIQSRKASLANLPDNIRP